MISVTSGDLQRNFGLYQDMALKEPIAITRNGRERTVLLSVEEYNRLQKRSRQVLLAHELNSEDLEAIANAEMDPRHAHLDAEYGLTQQD